VDKQMLAELYAILYNRIPRPINEATLAKEFSDKELRVLMKHNGMLINDYNPNSSSYNEKTKTAKCKILVDAAPTMIVPTRMPGAHVTSPNALAAAQTNGGRGKLGPSPGTSRAGGGAKRTGSRGGGGGRGARSGGRGRRGGGRGKAKVGRKTMAVLPSSGDRSRRRGGGRAYVEPEEESDEDDGGYGVAAGGGEEEEEEEEDEEEVYGAALGVGAGGDDYGDSADFGGAFASAEEYYDGEDEEGSDNGDDHGASGDASAASRTDPYASTRPEIPGLNKLAFNLDDDPALSPKTSLDRSAPRVMPITLAVLYRFRMVSRPVR
jgi:hypothetical protein